MNYNTNFMEYVLANILLKHLHNGYTWQKQTTVKFIIFETISDNNSR